MIKKLLAYVLLAPIYVICFVCALAIQLWTGRPPFPQWGSESEDV